MPITKQATKRMKQNRVRCARNRHYSSHMKSMIKLILDYAKKGELDKANTILPKVVSAIDVAAKKNLIHKHNAAHKKSRVQKALNVKPKAEPKTETKASASAKASSDKSASTKASSDKKEKAKEEKDEKKEEKKTK